MIIISIFFVLILFSFIIFTHELGHFLAARWRGLYVDRFQIGFGKPFWKKTVDGVQYGLAPIPFGGFVSLPQMASMETIEGSVENTDKEQLPEISPLDKIIVAFAGPLFSFLTAVLFAVIVFFCGKPDALYQETRIGYVQEGSPAAQAGLQAGDDILEIDDTAVEGFFGSLKSVRELIILGMERQTKFLVQRGDEQLTLYADPAFEEKAWYQRDGVRQVGIAPAQPLVIAAVNQNNSPAQLAGLQAGDEIVSIDGQAIYSFAVFSDKLNQHYAESGEPQLLALGYERDGLLLSTSLVPQKPIYPESIETPMIGITWQNYITRGIVYPSIAEQLKDGFLMIFRSMQVISNKNNHMSVAHFSGPVGIVGDLASILQSPDGWRFILSFMVVINVNLMIFNLLPLPVLDGGHITLAFLQLIRKKPVSARVLEPIQSFCALLLIGFMIFITTKDVGDNVNGWLDKLKKQAPQEQNEAIKAADIKFAAPQ